MNSISSILIFQYNNPNTEADSFIIGDHYGNEIFVNLWKEIPKEEVKKLLNAKGRLKIYGFVEVYYNEMGYRFAPSKTSIMDTGLIRSTMEVISNLSTIKDYTGQYIDIYYLTLLAVYKTDFEKWIYSNSIKNTIIASIITITIIEFCFVMFTRWINQGRIVELDGKVYKKSYLEFDWTRDINKNNLLNKIDISLALFFEIKRYNQNKIFEILYDGSNCWIINKSKLSTFLSDIENCMRKSNENSLDLTDYCSILTYQKTTELLLLNNTKFTEYKQLLLQLKYYKESFEEIIQFSILEKLVRNKNK